MAKIAQETIKEHPIEIVDQPEETSSNRRFNFWLLIPAALVIAGGLFFMISRILNKEK
jgi:hypothetical protein